MSYLIQAPDPRPICRTLRRLRNDMAMIGRTVERPISEPSVEMLKQTAENAVKAISAYLRSRANALVDACVIRGAIHPFNARNPCVTMLST